MCKFHDQKNLFYVETKKCLKLRKQDRVIPIDSNGCRIERGDLHILKIRAREGNASQHS